MKREKGIAFCGLACCVCSENEGCAGCRADGCKNKDWCKSFRCGREKDIAGCWACPEFDTCDNFMLKKPKVRAFAHFAAQYGTETLLDCLARNEADGVVYHYPGGLVGDYDDLPTEAAVFDLLLHGKTAAAQKVFD